VVDESDAQPTIARSLDHGASNGCVQATRYSRPTNWHRSIANEILVRIANRDDGSADSAIFAASAADHASPSA
jgi:hypothetical protein